MTSEESRREPQEILWTRDALPGEWLGLAEELCEAAELLWEHSTGIRGSAVWGEKLPTQYFGPFKVVSRPYILLAGFALENLLKGLLVADDPSLINQPNLHAQLKSHSLTSLAQRISGLHLTPDESALLGFAEQAIPYWGRYPVPLQSSGLVPDTGVTEAQRLCYVDLHQKLGSMLYLRIRDGWDSGSGVRSQSIVIARYEARSE